MISILHSYNIIGMPNILNTAHDRWENENVMMFDLNYKCNGYFNRRYIIRRTLRNYYDNHIII